MSLPLLLPYHLPFLLVSLKIGWIKIPVLASTEAPELQKIILIHAWDHSWFSSDLLLCLNGFDQARRFSKCLFLPFVTSASYLTLQDPCQCPGALTDFRAACSDCRAGVSHSCASLIKFLRCFSLFLCCHKKREKPRNLRVYQASKMEFDVVFYHSVL